MTPKIGTIVLLCIERHYHPIPAIITSSLESCDYVSLRAVTPTPEGDIAATNVRHGDMGEIDTIDSSGRRGKMQGMWLSLGESASWIPKPGPDGGFFFMEWGLLPYLAELVRPG